MFIDSVTTNKKERENMKIAEYKINEKFSGALISLNGKHKRIKNKVEDRIYFIISGSGTFIVGTEVHQVKKFDLVFIPKMTEYEMEGDLQYFLISSPEFNRDNDIVV
jgi:mannose-6-phosphate isomerase-like protein (cupin superfamily)